MLVILFLVSTVYAEGGHRVIRPDGSIEPYDDPLASIPQTCRRKGGVDCTKGADEDGSVICIDGSKDSAQKFSDECTTARITIVNEEIVGEEKLVAVRNLSSVTAKGIEVSLSRLDRTKTRYEGPKEIEPFGVAEFRGRKGNSYETLSVQCENCN